MEIKLKELRARGVKIKKVESLQINPDAPAEPPMRISLRFSFNDEDALWIPRELREAQVDAIVTFDEHPDQEYIISVTEEDFLAGHWMMHTLIYDREEAAAEERWDD